MRKFKKLIDKDVGAIGIGAMIVFIAMVLVAGIAASVLIQTSTSLESQAMKTGSDTIEEVSTGLAVFDIKGYAATSGNLDKLSICVRPRAGSADIDLNETFVELSDTNYKIVFNYSWTCYVADGSGQDDVFGADFFPAHAGYFGLLVLEDADDSCAGGTPVINKGDKVLLGIDTATSFPDNTGINARTDMWGLVVPEQGSPGVIAFTTPSSYTDNVFDLQ
jgi:flagellin FlaB